MKSEFILIRDVQTRCVLDLRLNLYLDLQKFFRLLQEPITFEYLFPRNSVFFLILKHLSDDL